MQSATKRPVCISGTPSGHIFAYICKVVWPANLSVMYPYPQHPHPGWLVALAAAGIFLVTLAVMGWRSQPYLAVGWLFYVIGMLPVIGIIQVGGQSLADRHVYTPAIGIFLMAFWGGDEFLGRHTIRPRIAAFLGAALVVAYASATMAYLPSWKNSYTLFARAERLSPVSDLLIETNLGEGLSALGRDREAVLRYQQAIALAPQAALPHYDLGNSLLHSGDAAGAVAEFRVALQLSPNLKLQERCLNNLASAELALNQPDLAEKNFSAALVIDPVGERSLAGRGQARLRLGRLDQAIDDLQRAVVLSPDPIAYYWLGKSFAAHHQPQSAEAALREALRLAPGLREAQTELDDLTRTSTK
jgi:protein O-mannosyl-transferase